MEKLNRKITTCVEALKTLQQSIEFFKKQSTHYDDTVFLAARDSMIQRFEYCTDLLWKVIKIYLEDNEKVEILVPSPKGIIRQAVNIRFLSEDEGNLAMNLIESRNKTSHIYHQELATAIAHDIPSYYDLMISIINRLSKTGALTL